jgi:peptidoglycan/LPS O-acetylase OafA/YrhL
MSASATRSADGFRPDLEGLRGVAVLLVIACHCGISWCAGGFVGVDVFFVLSGYLITGLLAAELQATSRIDLPGFFARRARRLLPAALLVFLMTALAATALLGPQEVESTARSAIAAACYVSNVLFDHAAADYFAATVEANPLLHTWSLGVEEQFYLLWPLLILAASRGQKRIGQTSVVLCGIAVASFACSVHATNIAPTFAFYELPARAWEFAAGGLLALLPAAGSSSAASAFAAGMGGIGLILGTAVLAHGGSGFPGWIASLVVIGTLAVIHSGAQASGRGVNWLLSTSPLRFLGARSYSWYLWHWPFVVYVGVVVPDITATGKIASSIAALIVAAATYRYIEHPIRAARWLGARSKMSLGFAAGATTMVVAVSGALVIHSKQQLATDNELASIGAASADFGNVPKGCWTEANSFDVKVCEFGPAEATRSLVLFGDSHALQWVNPMRTVTNLEGWRMMIVSRLGCAASEINPYRRSPDADPCRRWRSHAIEAIIAAHPTVVVMASYNGWTIRGNHETSNIITADEVRMGTRQTLEKLRHAGIAVVVLRDSPLPPSSIPPCLSRHIGEPGAKNACDFDASVGLNGAAFAAEQSAAEGLDNVYFLDMNDLICPGVRCAAVLGKRIVYRDENHLTGSFVESLTPMLRARLFQIPIMRPQVGSCSDVVAQSGCKLVKQQANPAS